MSLIMADGVPPIYPSRGVCQECCYSPLVFILVVKLLNLAIRQNRAIPRIKINNSTIKSGQCADDLWTVTPASSSNLNELLREMDNFREYSGLRVNPTKCVVLKLGPFRNTDAKYYTLKKLFWSDGSIKILGFWLHPD